MTSVSPLSNVLVKGLYGDHEGKKEDDLDKSNEMPQYQYVEKKNKSA